jgi:phage baseplate assembly protein W
MADAGWGFPPEFFNNGEAVRLATDEEDVKESLEILFSTAIRERLNYPDYGCDLKRFMFEEVNQTLIVGLEKMIFNAIYDYEPRIDVQKIEITESEANAHILLININYLIHGISDLQSMVYPVSLY